MKLVELENTNYKMSERIEELERCNAKLSEDMKLFEEREKRRFKGARPKVLERLDSDLEERILKEAEESKKVKMSYSDKVINGLADSKANAMMKESKMVKEVNEMQKESETVGEEEEKKDKLSKGLEDMGANPLLEEIGKTGEEGKDKVAKNIKYNNSGQNSSLDLDLLAEARRCIGLHPVKPSHILKYHEEDYEISTDDIPLLHNL